MNLKNDTLLKGYILIVLYSSVLRLILGRWATIIADIFTIILLLHIAFNKGTFKFRIEKKVKKLMICVFIVQLIAIFEIFNSNIQNTLYAIIEYRKSYFQMLALIVSYCIYKQSTLTLNYILKFIGLSSLPIVIYGIKQYFFWGPIDTRFVDMVDSGADTLRYGGHMRSVSIFSGPFHYGTFCVLIFAVMLYLWQIEHKKIYLFYIAFCAYGCYCSITRTNLVCLIAVAIVWYLMYLKSDNSLNSTFKKVLSLFLILLLALVLFLGLFDFTFKNNTLGSLLNSISHMGQDNRFNGRKLTWATALKYIVQNPIVGYGVGAAGDTMASHNVASISINATHSMFYKLAMEVGIIGTFIYAMVFALSSFRIYHSYNYKKRTLFYVLSSCILLNGFVGSTISMFPIMPLYWIFTGILLTQSEVSAKKI